MAIQKAQANFYTTDTTVDIIHYETQASQVKLIKADGTVGDSLDDMVFKGKLLQSVDLNTVKDTGMYRVKGCTNVPAGLSANTTYYMETKAIDNGGTAVVVQKLYDQSTKLTHERLINGSTVNAWTCVEKSLTDRIVSLETTVTSVSQQVQANATKNAELDTKMTFPNGITVQGHNIYFQNTAPSNPKTGDIWFNV